MLNVLALIMIVALIFVTLMGLACISGYLLIFFIMRLIGVRNVPKRD